MTSSSSSSISAQTELPPPHSLPPPHPGESQEEEETAACVQQRVTLPNLMQETQDATQVYKGRSYFGNGDKMALLLIKTAFQRFGDN